MRPLLFVWKLPLRGWVRPQPWKMETASRWSYWTATLPGRWISRKRTQDRRVARHSSNKVEPKVSSSSLAANEVFLAVFSGSLHDWWLIWSFHFRNKWLLPIFEKNPFSFRSFEPEPRLVSPPSRSLAAGWHWKHSERSFERVEKSFSKYLSWLQRRLLIIFLQIFFPSKTSCYFSLHPLVVIMIQWTSKSKP